MKRATVVAVLLAGCVWAEAQAPGVPVYRQGRGESNYEAELNDAAREIFSSGKAVKLAAIREQLKRAACQLDLPHASTNRLTTRALCDTARRGHLRVGWAYFCQHCDELHLNLAGGYSLTTDGAVATCFHVVEPDRGIKDGCLVAADESGKMFAVAEVLAANRYSDACIIRVAGEGFQPLPLSTNIFPGDAAYCYSDPLDHRGYFSAGIVNRFYQFPGRRPIDAPPEAAYAPMRINLSTDWAPGSSGSAVLDEFGNAIGHVSTISALTDNTPSEDEKRRPAPPPMIVFHEAVGAGDVLRLIQPRK